MTLTPEQAYRLGYKASTIFFALLNVAIVVVPIYIIRKIRKNRQEKKELEVIE